MRRMAGPPTDSVPFHESRSSATTFLAGRRRSFLPVDADPTARPRLPLRGVGAAPEPRTSSTRRSRCRGTRRRKKRDRERRQQPPGFACKAHASGQTSPLRSPAGAPNWRSRAIRSSTMHPLTLHVTLDAVLLALQHRASASATRRCPAPTRSCGSVSPVTPTRLGRSRDVAPPSGASKSPARATFSARSSAAGIAGAAKMSAAASSSSSTSLPSPPLKRQLGR